MLQFGHGLAYTEPQRELVIHYGVSQVKLATLIQSFQQFSIELISLFVTKTYQVKQFIIQFMLHLV